MAAGEARRVAMVLSNDAAADPRVEKEARALADASWAVTVVAWDRAQELPAREQRDGFDVVRCGPTARHGGGLGNIGAYRRFWRTAAERVSAMAPRVIHCHDADTIPVFLAARRACRDARFVLDLHELYAESRMIPQRGWKGALARTAVTRVEGRGVREADLVIVANPGQTAHIAGLGGPRIGSDAAVDAVPQCRVGPRLVLVENAPDLRRFPQRAEPRGPGTPMRVCFIGQKRSVGQLEALMRAIQPISGAHALLAGGGTAAPDIERLAIEYDRVETIGRVPYDTIPGLYAGCDVVYAVYDTTYGNYRTHFPVKAMEGMAIGVPVIVSEGTWVADFVEREGVGVAVRPSDPDSIRRVLQDLCDDPARAARMGARGRAIVEERLNWAAAANRLVGAYAALTEGTQVSGV